MTTMKLTAEQQAIVALVQSGAPRVLVEALAGTGKTSTIAACLAEEVTARKILLCCSARSANRTPLILALGSLRR